MIYRLVEFSACFATKRKAVFTLGSFFIVALGLSLLMPDNGLAVAPIFQSPGTSPPTATPPPPPPTNTPPPPTATPPPPTDTPPPPPPPTDTPLPPATEPPQQASPTPLPTDTPLPTVGRPTDTPSPPATLDLAPTATATALAIEPQPPVQEPLVIASSELLEEPAADPQALVINEIELVDTIAILFSYGWLCCGAGILLLIPLGFLFMQIRGNRIRRK
ncbi:MAG: hypothetical protein ACE5H9_20560 [Anaerolineae bacterium]